MMRAEGGERRACGAGRGGAGVERRRMRCVESKRMDASTGVESKRASRCAFLAYSVRRIRFLRCRHLMSHGHGTRSASSLALPFQLRCAHTAHGVLDA
eukprot:2880687-Rhodomonas_salina.1